METTKLYVEYIVVGMETLAIIFLVIFIIIGNAIFYQLFKYCIKKYSAIDYYARVVLYFRIDR